MLIDAPKVVLAVFVFGEHSGMVAPDKWEREQQRFQAAARGEEGAAAAAASIASKPELDPDRYPMGSLPLQVCVPYFMMISGALYYKSQTDLGVAVLWLMLFLLVGVSLNMFGAYVLDPAKLVKQPDGTTVLERYCLITRFFEPESRLQIFKLSLATITMYWSGSSISVVISVSS